MKAADAAIPKTSNSHRKLCKPWWNSACHQAKKDKTVFSGGTPPLLISYRLNVQKCVFVECEVKIREILGSSTYLRSHRQLLVNSYGEK
ncbi:hypothetical protein TNCV_1598091 [Trichonephila clavipes]|nr:hypothetical protein TNCV_1598091 [Trichonephila clavipes]